MSALGGIGAAPLVRRRSLGPAPLWLLALPIGAVLLLPLAFVGVQASSAGWTKAIHLLRLPHVEELLRNTIELVVLVTPLCAIVGAGVAWLLERTDLPGRRFWAVLLALPLAVPEFVNGYAWIGLDDRVRGLWGAVLVSTLSYYPLVMLPAIATLRRADSALEDVARSQGLRSLAVFRRVTLPQLRLALLGGGLIIALHLLAEYGAFSLLGFRTFTTEIYTEYQLGFDAASSAVLSLVLVGLCLLLLGAESGLPGPHAADLGDAVEAPPLAARAARRAGGCRARRACGAGGRSPGRGAGLLADRRLLHHSAVELDRRRGRLDRHARARGRADHDPRGHPSRRARRALPDAAGATARAQRLHRAGHAGPDHRAGARATSPCATPSRSTSPPCCW